MSFSACPAGTCRCCCKFLDGGESLSAEPIDIHRITELLGTNDPPSDAEAAVLKSRLHIIEQDLEVLSDHIEHINSTSAALNDLKREKIEDARSYRNILHPLRRLPVELLFKIFCDARPSFTMPRPLVASGTWKDSSINTSRYPWTLTYVSSRWRQVALSLPEIWSRIVLYETEKNSNAWNTATLGGSEESISWTDKHSHLLSLQLERSRSSLLTVSIEKKIISNVVPVDHPLLPLLLPTSPRWKFLCLSYNDLPAFSPIQGNLQALQTLQLSNGHLNSSNPIEAMHFAVAPKLQTAYIRSPGPLVALPFPQMNNFVLSDISNVDNCTSFLAKLDATDWCQLDFSPYNIISHPLSPPQFPPLALCSLRILELQLTSPDLKALFETLTLPALQVLHITMKGGLGHAVPFGEFFRRSQCPLKVLRIRSRLSFCSETLVSALEEVPSLEKMTLDATLAHSTDWPSVIAKGLGDRSDLIPSLQSLQLLYSDHYCRDDDEGIFLAFKQTFPSLNLEIQRDVIGVSRRRSEQFLLGRSR